MNITSYNTVTNKRYRFSMIEVDEDDNCIADLSHVLTKTIVGSVAGTLAENTIAYHLNNLAEHSPSKGYDLISHVRKRPIEVKSLTRHGAKFCHSKDVGAGRKIDHTDFDKYAREKDFILADTRNFSGGELTFTILSGSSIAEAGASVSVKKAEKLFDLAQGSEVDW